MESSMYSCQGVVLRIVEYSNEQLSTSSSHVRYWMYGTTFCCYYIDNPLNSSNLYYLFVILLDGNSPSLKTIILEGISFYYSMIH